MPAASYDELVALVGLSEIERAELDCDRDLARELLQRAISSTSVRLPGPYVLSAFRARRAQTRRRARRARPAAGQGAATAHAARGYLAEPRVADGPPPDEIVERLRTDSELRALIGRTVAAALRRYDRPVPEWLSNL